MLSRLRYGLVKPVVFVVAGAFVLVAIDAVAAAQGDVDRISDTMKKTLAGRAEVKSVKSTPIQGLYEVSIGGGVVYTDASARYVINGAMVDTRTGANLTEERVNELNRINWSSLPLTNAIKSVKGAGGRQIAVFSDPNCPYCKQLERTLQQLDNVTVYTFLYPVLSPDSEAKAKQIWCSADKARAWQDWMLSKVVPTGKGACKTPIRGNLALGQELNVTGTPGVFFADGSRLSGAADVATLERKLAAVRN